MDNSTLQSLLSMRRPIWVRRGGTLVAYETNEPCVLDVYTRSSNGFNFYCQLLICVKGIRKWKEKKLRCLP